jgi:hypothetical protein
MRTSQLESNVALHSVIDKGFSQHLVANSSTSELVSYDTYLPSRELSGLRNTSGYGSASGSKRSTVGEQDDRIACNGSCNWSLESGSSDEEEMRLWKHGTHSCTSLPDNIITGSNATQAPCETGS